MNILVRMGEEEINKLNIQYEGFEFCSKCDEKQGHGECFRGLAATKYFNSSELNIVVPHYQWGCRRQLTNVSLNPSWCPPNYPEIIDNPEPYVYCFFIYLPMIKFSL